MKALMRANNAKHGPQKPTLSCRASVMPLGLATSGDFRIFATRTEEVILIKPSHLYIEKHKIADNFYLKQL